MYIYIYMYIIVCIYIHKFGTYALYIPLYINGYTYIRTNIHLCMCKYVYVMCVCVWSVCACVCMCSLHICSTHICTHTCEMLQAEENPDWLKEARHGEHTPESVEYAISSFTFRSRCPFHPSKLHAALKRATASLNRGAGFGSCASAAREWRAAGGLDDPMEALESIVRAKGIAYVATAGGWNMQATLSLAGSRTYVLPGDCLLVLFLLLSCPQVNCLYGCSGLQTRIKPMCFMTSFNTNKTCHQDHHGGPIWIVTTGPRASPTPSCRSGTRSTATGRLSW